MLDKKNCCNEPFQAYIKHIIKGLSDKVPNHRKLILAEEITARANLLGCKNKSALRLAVAHLRGERPKRIRRKK